MNTATNTTVLILLAAILASAFALAGGSQQAHAVDGVEEAEERAEEAAERAEERAEEAEERAEEAKEEAEDKAEKQAKSTERRSGETEGKNRGSEDVTVKIQGNPETEFSGTCTVGDEENEIEGQVPQSFDYDLDGQKLECKIQQQNAGTLTVVLTGDGARAVQKIHSRGGTLNLTYGGNGIISFSTSSSGSTRHVSSSSMSSSSSVSSSSISSSISIR